MNEIEQKGEAKVYETPQSVKSKGKMKWKERGRELRLGPEVLIFPIYKLMKKRRQQTTWSLGPTLPTAGVPRGDSS